MNVSSSFGAMAAAMQPYIDQKIVPGVVTSVAMPDRTLDTMALGYADIDGLKSMEKDAVFWIASMTKPMTATALMMLVDEGKVSIEDPVARFIPSFAGLKVGGPDGPRELQRPILVRDILSHTSGLPFSVPAESPTFDGLTLEDAVEAYAGVELLFQPGERYNYANAGTNTVGRLVELLSGISYETFMAERIFQPLGMAETTFRPDGPMLDRVVDSYQLNEAKTELKHVQISQLAYPLNNPRRQPMPAGGLFSTAADVVKFCQFIARGGVQDGRQLLSRESIAAMTSRQTPESDPTSYGLGWSASPERYGHGGAHKTRMNINRSTGRISVFLIQLNGPWPKDEFTMEETFETTAAALED